ncbi:hypothetical protein [Agarivorans sp. QJM3NY_25]|uniref:hypothetical protein n=1 Tax=Agarivorans sp. QJM3NY_25 TaxID=3421430 RepID=UPI003D7F10C2
MKRVLTYWIGFCCGLFSGDSSTDDLLVGKVCPVSYQQQALGILVFLKLGIIVADSRLLMSPVIMPLAWG